VVTAVGSGTAVVTAESGDHSAAVEVQVQPAASIQMDPADLALASIGATGTVTATLRDAEGAEIVGVPLDWSSSDEDVVTVDAEGTVEAIGVGTATVSAGIGSIEGTTTVTVSQEADAIELTPAEVTLVTAGATAQLTAVVTDAGGTEIEGAVVTWTSSDPEVATVDSEGEVTAVANGTAVITAQSGEATATSTVTVDIDD
jgi:trimeric autotransporter adhesin